MSSRAEEKAARRAEREAAQAKQQAADQRKKRLSILGGVVALVAVIVVGAVLLSQSGTEDSEPGGSAEGKAAAALVNGIPQEGMALGEPDAPVTIEEYVDFQCPFCGDFSRDVFPTVLEDHVRTGQVRVVLRPLTFLGEDSVTAARFAVAAGEQNRLWQFTEAFYAQQGEENSGYVTDEFLRSVAADAGVDFDRAVEQQGTEAVTKELNDAQLEASRKGRDSTPSFAMGPTGGEIEAVDINALNVEEFTAEVERQVEAAKR